MVNTSIGMFCPHGSYFQPLIVAMADEERLGVEDIIFEVLIEFWNFDRYEKYFSIYSLLLKGIYQHSIRIHEIIWDVKMKICINGKSPKIIAAKLKVTLHN